MSLVNTYPEYIICINITDYFNIKIKKNTKSKYEFSVLPSMIKFTFMTHVNP